jgi:uncharacterized protein (TIGR03435 family)
MKRFALPALLCLAAAQPVAFEVASVKAAAEPAHEPMMCLAPCTVGERLTVEGSRVDIRDMSLQRLILTAYAVKPYQLSGPDWMSSSRFDIAARIPAGVTRDHLPEMLQALLAERFKLVIHRVTGELPVYALMVATNGPKLRQAAADAPSGPTPDTPGSLALYTPQGEARMLPDHSFVASGGPFGVVRGGLAEDGGMKWEFLNLTMPGLAELLGPHMDRPVIDRTGLTGGYYLVGKTVRSPIVAAQGSQQRRALGRWGFSAGSQTSGPLRRRHHRRH